MIKKVVKKANLNSFSEIKEDLAYWLTKTPEERIAAVDYLRSLDSGTTARLQRTIRVIKRQQS